MGKAPLNNPIRGHSRYRIVVRRLSNSPRPYGWEIHDDEGDWRVRGPENVTVHSEKRWKQAQRRCKGIGSRDEAPAPGTRPQMKALASACDPRTHVGQDREAAPLGAGHKRLKSRSLDDGGPCGPTNRPPPVSRFWLQPRRPCGLAGSPGAWLRRQRCGRSPGWAPDDAPSRGTWTVTLTQSRGKAPWLALGDRDRGDAQSAGPPISALGHRPSTWRADQQVQRDVL